MMSLVLCRSSNCSTTVIWQPVHVLSRAAATPARFSTLWHVSATTSTQCCTVQIPKLAVQKQTDFCVFRICLAACRFCQAGSVDPCRIQRQVPQRPFCLYMSMSAHNHSCKHHPDHSHKELLTGVQVIARACNTVQRLRMLPAFSWLLVVVFALKSSCNTGVCELLSVYVFDKCKMVAVL